MAFNVTSNYAGKAAGFYISAALQSVVSLDYITMMENIKFQKSLQIMDAAVTPVAAATCNFTDAGTLNLTEKTLVPANNQINLDLCKAELLDSWEAMTMRAGAGAPPPATFDDYVISYMGDIIASATETSIWAGVANAGGDFVGFTGAGAAGWLRAGAPDPATQAVLTGGAGVAPIATTIIDDLQATVDAIPAAVIGKDDLYLFINQQNWQMYIQAVSALTGFPYGNMSDDYTKQFNGIKIAVVNGLQNAAIVAATKSNLFFGTDLISDATRIQLLDMASLDGSDNMRMVCRYSAGTQTGIGADCVLTS